MHSPIRSLSSTLPTAVLTVALLSVILIAAPAGAETPVPRCNDLATTLHAIDPLDDVMGTPGDDVILLFPDGGVTVYGLGGNDTICVEGSSDFDITVEGGPGNDVLIGESLFGQINLNSGFTRPTTVLNGGAGNDTIHGTRGFDRIDGGTGDDLIFGYQEQDFLSGGDGNDIIHGGLGLDEIRAGAGDDTVFGGPGNDTIYGELGRDMLFGGAGNDILLSNTDLHDETSNAVSHGLTEDPIGTNSASVDLDIAGARMFGGPGNDLLIGSNRWDRMQGGDGDDSLFGLEGRDWMRGGAGNDIIMGGANIDDMNGNLGKDEMIAVGTDIVSGGHGEDACFFGPFSAESTLSRCETVEFAGPEYHDVSGRVSQRHFG